MYQQKKMISTIRTALITGCGAGGIGEALAKGFHAKGFDVFATFLPNEPRAHLEDTGVTCFTLDVTNDEDVSTLYTKLFQHTNGKLSVLVNNAGVAYTMPATDTEVKEVEKMFAVNVFGPMRMVATFHKDVIKAEGTIVNIGSVGGIVPYVYGSSYNASKAALHHYGNTLRVEMKPFGVKVINIISGEIGTNILKGDHDRTIPKGSVYEPLSEEFKAHVQRVPDTMSPEDYAKGVVEMVTSTSPPAWYWRGARSSSVRWIDTFCWRTIWDSIFAREFQLEKLSSKKLDVQ